MGLTIPHRRVSRADMPQAFNAVFGIKTNFAAVAAVDDQGNVIAGTGSGAASSASASSAAGTSASSSASANQAATTTASSAGGIGNFGKCSVPQIEFATGFDNRKETSFEPVDRSGSLSLITDESCD